MKINGTIFSKPQQDQLKRGIGAELDKVVAKVDDVDARMLNYTGDWTSGNEYHENDVVTWAQDGHLYEVIKAHTSSSTIAPSNTEYYKAMTADKVSSTVINNVNNSNTTALQTLISTVAGKMAKGRKVSVWVSQLDGGNIDMTPYTPDPNSKNCTLVGARRNSSTFALELCYLFVSSMAREELCKYVIFNAETMEAIKSGNYSGTVSVTA